MGRLDLLYQKLPVWGQHAAVSAYGVYWKWLRFGAGFQEHVGVYREREQAFSQAQWSTWQHNRLREVLSVAANLVPYYRDTWTKVQKQAASEGRLSGLPLLEKDAVRADPKRFLRGDVKPRYPLVFHTSGTTGTPVASYWTIDEFRESQAFHEVRGANWAGVSFSMPRATFSGRMVEPDPDSEGPYYRFNRVERQVYCSAFHLNARTANKYLDAWKRHGVEWLTGYGVSYFLLAQFILEQRLSPPRLRAIITTSEKVTPHMKQVMERAYRCPVFEEYNNVENVFFANDCEQGRLHVSPDVGIIEILRPDGTACDPGEVGEVVATCLFRTFQPFVRYRIGDCAAWDDEPCRCGRAMPVIKEVIGRLEDVVVGPDGRQMVRFHGIFTNQPHIKQGQIIQEALDSIRVKVIPTAGFGPDDIQDVTVRIQQRLGQVKVEVEPVDHIPVNKSGKFKAVVSLLKEKEALKAHGVGGF